jgi:integrase
MMNFKNKYEELYYAYLTHNDKMWDDSTYKSESSRLKTIVSVLEVSGFRGQDFYAELKRQGYKPYTIKVMVQRAAAMYSHGQKLKIVSAFNNPFFDLLASAPQLFRNAYKAERLKLDFDEAMKRVLTIPQENVREACISLLKSGLRIHEMYLVNKETSSVIGKGNKERFTTFAFPEHLELPSEWQVRTALKKIGLKPHSLRKLLATKLSRNSDIKNQDILAIMGWSSLETANKYLQPLNEQQLKQKMKEILE